VCIFSSISSHLLGHLLNSDKGTWKSQPGAVENAVEYALKNGYTHIDTATAYSNEKEVGAGIKASGVDRSKIFLTTKLDNPDQHRAEEALHDSLKWLETDYLDLCAPFHSYAFAFRD